ncbi:MAG: hypothetical protein CL874_01265 [Dehalococcoidales bacterium]|jgi:predicted amidohydrolase|nr:hypothetical protein [Dehalococcoidales bacterium]MDP6577386.1 carbon-nitrogen hydrolase family protein [Dehalococcoidales bacterium]|tara:strand:- start:942 stop:1907 length:966 start_codon:yes stop_codon:yes gene_type:complete
MKDVVKVSLVQFAPRWFAREENAERMRSFAEREAESGTELIVFPEAANIGYFNAEVGSPIAYDSTISFVDFAAKYVKAAEPIPGPTTDTLTEVCKRYGVYITVGIVQSHPVVKATLYNSAALIGPQGVMGVYHKMHLAQNEKLFFYPGNTCEVYATDLGNIGMTVCYDGRFPEISRILALKGAEIICSMWAMSGAAMELIAYLGNLKYRAYTRAQENGLYYLACNRSGKEGDQTFLGRSAIAGPSGEIIAASETDDEEVIKAKLENEKLVRYRVRQTIFRDRRPELYYPIVEPLSQPNHPPTKTPGEAPQAQLSKEEDDAR